MNICFKVVHTHNRNMTWHTWLNIPTTLCGKKPSMMPLLHNYKGYSGIIILVRFKCSASFLEGDQFFLNDLFELRLTHSIPATSILRCRMSILNNPHPQTDLWIDRTWDTRHETLLSCWTFLHERDDCLLMSLSTTMPKKKLFGRAYTIQKEESPMSPVNNDLLRFPVFDRSLASTVKFLQEFPEAM